jgi:molecular chaperone DnaK
MVYNVEKMLKDGGDKVQAADKSEVETALADAKSTLSGDPGKADMDGAREKLTAASHKLAEALYKANAASGAAPTDGAAAAEGTAEAPKQDEGVIDAEYVDAEQK